MPQRVCEVCSLPGSFYYFGVNPCFICGVHNDFAFQQFQLSIHHAVGEGELPGWRGHRVLRSMGDHIHQDFYTNNFHGIYLDAVAHQGFPQHPGFIFADNHQRQVVKCAAAAWIRDED